MGNYVGTYGRAGAASENFAIGAILYSIMRGYYPYANEKYDTVTFMDIFKKKQFPLLDDSTEDAIIWSCWQRQYQSVAELEQVYRDMRDETEWYLFDAEDDGLIKDCEADCIAWVNSGNFKSLPSIP